MERPNIFTISVFLVFILAFSAMLCAQRVIDLNEVWGDMRVMGRVTNDWTGYAVGSGDINGDGYMDIIIGAPQANPFGRYYAGEVYVLFGSSDPPSTIDLSTQSADITILGDNPEDYCGFAVASGDINNDDYDDLIVGAFVASASGGARVGKTYIIFGSSDPPSTIDLNTQYADITVCGDKPWDQSGYTVASGDVNGDGFDDVIIGTNGGEAPGGKNAGATYVIFGSSSLPYIIDLHSQQADIAVYGDDVDDFSGFDVSSGDVNGDGYCDLIIGAHMADPGGRFMTGETYVIYGGNFPMPPYTIDLSTQSADITIYGDKPEDNSGYTVASGDVNGDGYYDVIIGAWGADPGNRIEAGKTYVIFGGNSLPSIIDLNTQPADITVFGDDDGDKSSYALSSEDINGDGYHDIIIGAYAADAPGGPDAGKTYVVFGFDPPTPVTIDLSTSSAGITVYGDDESDWSGRAVASGDFNGDGWDDLIIGAPPHLKADVGKTYLIFGGPAILEAEIDIDPDSLNIKSKGKWITGYIELPEGYDPADIDVSTVKISKVDDTETIIQAEYWPFEIDDYDNDGIPDLMVKFDRQDIIDLLRELLESPSHVELTVTGELTDGTPFSSIDTIRVINKDKK